MKIATRGSALALWQANHVRDRLRAADPDLAVDLVVIRTRGDRILDVPLAKVGGKGLFVKEIEQALLDGRADLAVHSMKDVPADLEAGLALAAISERADPFDALVSRDGVRLDALPPGATVGTSSLRRQCQLRALRPDVTVVPLRGNVDTRLRKLDDGLFDAIVLASAGLVRLGHADRIVERLAPPAFLPAIAQGALGVETRADDADTIRRVRAALHCESDARRVRAERAVMARLDGGCQTPIAAFARLAGDALELSALVATPDGREVIRADRTGSSSEPEALGVAVAEELLARGADRILAACRAAG
ncbi:MAG: hydroxymethylbilane synthase [Deltaproteobacteria bacterium]|nr:MAG: hydroxymethylbilane synthase [Deltaproteobacteria bacterium]